MPEICRFHKIKIRMHFGDHEHPPPHFHAKSPGGNAMISLNGIIMEGSLPPAELRLVQSWAVQHAEELAANWDLCMRNESPFKIDPLK